MRLSFDNNYLFSAGEDGALIIHDVKDRDPRAGGKRDREGLGLNFSDEILTEKQELENYINEKENKEAEWNEVNSNENMGKMIDLKNLDDEINRLSEENGNA
jgi:hypothetical protein